MFVQLSIMKAKISLVMRMFIFIQQPKYIKRDTEYSAATEAYAKLRMCNKTAQIGNNAKIDTGAMSNLLTLCVFRQLKDVTLKEISLRLFKFGGSMTEQAEAYFLGVRYRMFNSAIFNFVKTKRPKTAGITNIQKITKSDTHLGNQGTQLGNKDILELLANEFNKNQGN